MRAVPSDSGLPPIDRKELREWALRCGLPERILRGLFDGRFPNGSVFAPQAPGIAQLHEAVADGRSLIVLAGPGGRGKSVAAGEFMLTTMAQRTTARWVPAGELTGRTAREIRLLLDGEPGQSRGLLVIDELGEEHFDDKGLLRSVLNTVLNARYDTMLDTVMTTNLPHEEFADRYGGRLYDRIVEIGAYIELTGPNLRHPPPGGGSQEPPKRAE